MSEPDNWKTFLRDEAKKWLARTLMLAAGAALLWVMTPLGEQAREVWHTPDRLDRIEAKLERLVEDVRRATGEDRVIHEQAGQAYVTEPVHIGDLVTLNLVMRRTATGAGCTLAGWTPLFTDASNIDQPGEPISGMRRIDTEMARLRVTMQAPPTLRAGRVTVRLALEYECAGQRVYDSTAAVPFVLVET